MRKLILLLCLLHTVFAAPQLLTFKDGKVGVNFGGYHAEAGLGGLLTGNAAHGGLSASAGTPFGQRAGAGLGGSVNGNPAGVLYAGAEANPQVGAGAVLGGETGVGGYGGSTAFANGKTATRTITHTRHNTLTQNAPTTFGPEPNSYDGIQYVKPARKHALIKPDGQIVANANTNVNAEANVVHSKHLIKRVENAPVAPVAPLPLPEMNLNVGPGVVQSALNIPINILRAIQESFSGFDANKQYH